jgi:SAM-dependent methyltransferase
MSHNISHLHGRDAGYDDAFYDQIVEPAQRSAAVVVPLLLELATDDHPISSAVDVGCGLGTWLAAFAENGVADVVGLESDHLPTDRLAIRRDQLVIADLTAPPDVGRRFDLALSLEVAEHLPASAAAGFVDLLCGLAPMVVFSAAVPGQGGVHHVNEQWPAWWSTQFADRGYAAYDCIRPRVWRDERVAYYYAQNTIIYVDRAATVRLSAELGEPELDGPMALVHPGLFQAFRDHRSRPADPSLRSLLRQLPRAAAGAARRRVRPTSTGDPTGATS